MAVARSWIRRGLESQIARPILLIVAIFVLWELVIRVFRIPPYLIPAPLAVAKMLVAEWPRLWQNGLFTAYATLGGFALSILIGIPIAMLIAYSRLVESYVYPLLVFSQSVPKIAIAPLFVVWFGFGIFPKVISAFMLVYILASAHRRPKKAAEPSAEEEEAQIEEEEGEEEDEEAAEAAFRFREGDDES